MTPEDLITPANQRRAVPYVRRWKKTQPPEEWPVMCLAALTVAAGAPEHEVDALCEDPRVIQAAENVARKARIR